MEPYTVALTSCGRFDLLERTLASLLPRLEGPLAAIFIAEDSGDTRVHDVVRKFDGGREKIEVIVNQPPLGQVKSIDRLYSRIETEWIFHCEDDWEFFDENFIEKSFAILKEFDCFSMVHLRDKTELAPFYFCPEAISSSGVRYHPVNPSVAGVYTGLSFNPGLRRMRDYRIVGPYAHLGPGVGEARVADCYRRLGYMVACVAEAAVRHIGDGRHVHSQAKPIGLYNRTILLIKERLARWRWKLDPNTDPVLGAIRRLEEAKARSDHLGSRSL